MTKLSQKVQKLFEEDGGLEDHLSVSPKIIICVDGSIANIFRVLLRFQIQKNLDRFLFWPQMTLLLTLPLQSWVAYGEDEKTHKALLKDFPHKLEAPEFCKSFFCSVGL